MTSNRRSIFKLIARQKMFYINMNCPDSMINGTVVKTMILSL